MGIVTAHLFKLIAKQVEDHRLVVWYDPEQAYATAAAELELPNATVARYDGSFFQLRHDIDALLNDEQPPRLVVYVPDDRGNTHNALIELEAAGVIMQPGQQPPHRNTRLAIIARNALKSILGDETAAEIEKQVEAGKLSLADLNSLAEKGKDISTGVLSLIFGTANPQDVALAFLHSDAYDKEITKKAAQKDLVGLLQYAFGVDLPANASLAASRESLARHVLMTDLITGLGDAVPASLAAVHIAAEPSTKAACIGLARPWRLRRDVRDSYVAATMQKEDVAELVAIALEGRRRVKEQLKKMGSFEYHQTSFSYIDNETREEWYVGVPEEGGRDLISPDPLAPSSVYTASVDDHGKVGLYRLEVGCSTGTGKLRVAGGVDSGMRESIQRAFAYIQGHKVNMGIAQAFDTTNFHVEAIDLLTNRVSCDAGIALVVAIYSALKEYAALPGLMVLGDLSIQGNIKAVRSLAEPLQVGMDNGARRALIPIENKRNFLDVSADIVERVDPIFYGDPLTAAMKALGMT
jgi:hypothetical protein